MSLINMEFVEEIKQSFKAIKKEKKQLRQFAILFIIIFSGIFLYLFFIDVKTLFLWIFLLLIFYFIAGYVNYKWLYYPYVAWMGFSVVLGFFISRILLSLIYFLLMTPIGALMRIVKGDFLNKKYDLNKETYWIEKDKPKNIKENLEKLY